MSDAVFIVDHSQVDKNLEIIFNTTIPGLADEGLFEMAKQLVNDAVNVEPTVPKGHARAKAGKRTGVGGELRRSWKIEKGTAGQLIVGFDMPYAAYQHAGQRSDGTHVVQKWTEPGAGREFLKKKLEMFKDVYIKKLADFVKTRGGT